MIIPSLWFYLHDVIKTDHVRFYYDLILAIYYVASVFGGLTISLYADRTRNMKHIVLMLICFEIFGSCIYSVYTSVNFVIVGRIIQGFGDVIWALMIAEIARVFPAEECTKKIANIITCFSIAFVMSPGLNILFKYIDFNAFGFHVNYGNFPGIFLAMLFSFTFAFAFNGLTNLSKDRDMKHFITINTTNNTIVDFQEFQPLYLFLQFDFVLLVFLAFFTSYSMVSFLEVSFPIISSLYFHQSSQFVSGMFLATGLFFMVSLQLIKKLSKRVNDLTFLIGGLCVFIVSTALLLCVSLIKDDHHHHVIGMILMVCFVLLLGICWCVEQVVVNRSASVWRGSTKSSQLFCSHLRQYGDRTIDRISSYPMHGHTDFKSSYNFCTIGAEEVFEGSSTVCP